MGPTRRRPLADQAIVKNIDNNHQCTSEFAEPLDVILSDPALTAGAKREDVTKGRRVAGLVCSSQAPTSWPGTPRVVLDAALRWRDADEIEPLVGFEWPTPRREDRC